MSEFTRVMMITEAEVAAFEQYFIETELQLTEPYAPRIDGALGDSSLTVIVKNNPFRVTSPHFQGQIHNREITIADDMFRGGDMQRARYAAALIVKLAQRGDISALSCENYDEGCFLYWNGGDVVVNSDPPIWAMPDSVALREALEGAGIEYRAEDLGHYFHDPDA